jgi:hypothetical protein
MHIVAYIDPGAGAMLIQALVAGAIAIPFFFRSAIARAVHRLRGQQAANGKSEPPRPH